MNPSADESGPVKDDLGAGLVTRLRAAGCVFAEEEAALLIRETSDAPDLERRVAAREAGTPLEQVLGWVEFHGLRLVLQPGVFVPRQRTTLLVDVAIPLVRPGSTVVDLGCGSGAIAAALRHAVPGLDLWAVDVDPAAVACARRNLPPERVRAGDLYDALPDELRRRVDLVAANAPYVPTAAIARMPREARDHEHLVALDGGPDGLDVQRRVAAGAPAWLRPGGHLVVETGHAQVRVSVAVMRAAGLDTRVVHHEDPEGPRGSVVVGRLPVT